MEGKEIRNMLFQFKHRYGEACKELITKESPKGFVDFLRASYSTCDKLSKIEGNLPKAAFSKLCHHVNAAKKENKTISEYAKSFVAQQIEHELAKYKKFKVSYDLVYKDTYMHYEEDVTLERYEMLQRGGYVKNLTIIKGEN